MRRVVSASAYLLFYRRRSEGLLGGSRFLEILNQHEKPETSEDDEAEAEADSGEGQGLDVKSSLRGSSSALTGVGAAPHQTSGSGIEMGPTMTVNPQDLDALPTYQAHETEEDGAPLLQSDAVLNDGLGLRSSIEQDEGIDVSMGYNTMNLDNHDRVGFTTSENWTWGSLENFSVQHNARISGTGSEIDLNDNSGFDADGSDVVQHNSSASPGSIHGRIDDFENAIPMDDDGVPFVDPSPVPDMDDETQFDVLTLQRELLGTHDAPHLQVRAPAEDDEFDEPATEIHLESGENDDLKMD